MRKISLHPGQEEIAKIKSLKKAKNKIDGSGFEDDIKRDLITHTDDWLPVKWELNKLIEEGLVNRENEHSILSALYQISDNYKKSKVKPIKVTPISLEEAELSILKDALKKADELYQLLAGLDYLKVKSIGFLIDALSAFIEESTPLKKPAYRPVSYPRNILFRSFIMVWVAYTSDKELSNNSIGLAKAFLVASRYPALREASDKDFLKSFSDAEARGKQYKIDLPFLIGNYKGIN